jgi:hypothetical protein
VKNSQLKQAGFEQPHLLSSNQGFSLVQVMVSVGIMGGLALMMMTMMENQAKQQKTIELKSEQNDIKAIIKQVLANKDACDATFVSMAPGDEIFEIRTMADPSIAPFAKTGVKFKNMNVYIKKIRLLSRQEELDVGHRPLTNPPTPPISYTSSNGPPNGFGTGWLRINFVKNIGVVSDTNKSQQFYGARETSVDIPIFGHFYYDVMVNHSELEGLENECVQKATSYGVQCFPGNDNDRCWFERLNSTTHDEASDQDVFWGECRIFHDDAPFVECTTPK